MATMKTVVTNIACLEDTAADLGHGLFARKANEQTLKVSCPSAFSYVRLQ